MNLPDFLLQRIAEDEAAAKAATPGPWRVSDDPTYQVGFARGDGEFDETRMSRVTGYGGTVYPWDAAHIARHDPARVLARCEAERRIVERYSDVPMCGGYIEPGPERDEMVERLRFTPQWHLPEEYAHGCDGCASAEAYGRDAQFILRTLASVYRDHPEWDEGWAL